MPNLRCAYLSSLHCRQAQTDRDSASNHKGHFLTQYLKILDLEGHQNRISDSKVIFRVLYIPGIILTKRHEWAASNKFSRYFFVIVYQHWSEWNKCKTRQFIGPDSYNVPMYSEFWHISDSCRHIQVQNFLRGVVPHSWKCHTLPVFSDPDQDQSLQSSTKKRAQGSNKTKIAKKAGFHLLGPNPYYCVWYVGQIQCIDFGHSLVQCSGRSCVKCLWVAVYWARARRTTG